MVRTASAVAVLVFAAGLAAGANAQSPETAKPAAAVAAVSAPAAQPAAPSIGEAMRSQATADAPPAPPPPPEPTAAPLVAVAAAPLAPPLKFAFAAPPAKAKAVAAEPAAVKVAVMAPVAAAPAVIKVAEAAPAPQATPVLVKVSAPAPQIAPAPQTPAASAPAASALVARRVTDAAGAFDAWTEKASRIDGKFADAAGVSGALVDASAIQADQLEEGAVAYGALAALQDPVFVQSAHDLAALGPDHDAAAAILLKTPVEVMTLQGSDGAAAFAAQAIAKRALAVTTAGKSVRQAAYSLQADPWARAQILTPDKRLADAKIRSSAAVSLDASASAMLMKRLVELRTSRRSFAPATGTAAPTPLVTRSLALAAMIVLGEADEAHAAKLTPLLVEAKSSDCLKMAKLNFFQCLSVAGPHYEDAFCIGQHGLGEAGQCIASAVGAAVPVTVAAPPVLIAVAGPAPSAGVSVPIALLADDGPERSAAAAAPAIAVPLVIAQAAVVPTVSSAQPRWAQEEAAPPVAAQPMVQAPAAQDPSAQAYDDDQPRAYARQQAPRYDRSRAYIWDRQARSAEYVAPGYTTPYAAYGDPRAYGRYPVQPIRPAYDPRYDDRDDDDAPVAPPAYAGRGYGAYR